MRLIKLNFIKNQFKKKYSNNNSYKIDKIYKLFEKNILI